jgi:hypothetical protein
MQFVNQKRSNQNSINKGKQEMGSKVGTRSIAQIAYDLVRKKVTRQFFLSTTHYSELVNICFFIPMQRDLEIGEWSTTMQVLRATYQKADGTRYIPTGEEIMV